MGLIHEIDYGTPASQSEKMVTLTVDGRKSPCRKAPRSCAPRWRLGWKSRNCARPTCWTRSGPAASASSRSTAAAARRLPAPRRSARAWWCTPRRERLSALRRGVMELYVSDHPLGWDQKAGTGGSEFDKVVHRSGWRRTAMASTAATMSPPGNGSLNIDYIARDASNPYFTYDPTQCIVCSRCVRACEDVQGTFALTIEGRGFESRVSAGMHEAFIDSRMRLLRRLRAGLPDRCAARKIGPREGPARELRSSPPAPIAASAARSRPRCAAKKWCA